MAQPFTQVSKLLVGEGLNGCRVEGPASSGQRQVDGMLGHHRLAAGGGGRYQDRTPGVHGGHCLDLEAVELEGPAVGHSDPARRWRRALSAPTRIATS